MHSQCTIWYINCIYTFKQNRDFLSPQPCNLVWKSANHHAKFNTLKENPSFFLNTGSKAGNSSSSSLDKIKQGQSEDKIQLWLCLTLNYQDLLTLVISSYQMPSFSELNGCLESYRTACISVDKDFSLKQICDA